MYTKINEELFLEKAELLRVIKGIEEKGFLFDKQTDANTWGIIRNKKLDSLFDYFKIVSTGSFDKFKIKNGFAYDKDRLVIDYKYQDEDITIPLIATEYWVKISHIYESREVGTGSIGGVNMGTFTGVGTKFTEVLRGQPNFPAKIKFLNSVNYTLEYEVLEVVSDTTVILQGVFDLSESDLQYAVVGTFTYGYQPPTLHKEIFQYDSCQVDLVLNVGPVPTLIDGKEFIIGKVSYTGAGTVIEDYRWDYIFNTSDREHVDSISRVQPSNPIVGLEYIKKILPNANSAGFYLLGLDWKFRITSESQNNSISQVDITGGLGGVWLNTTSFQNGDFDGWRYYYADGNYSTILTSVIIGTTIKVTLDSVRIGSGAGVCVTPNAEDIEVYHVFLNTVGAEIYKKMDMFGIAMENPSIQIGVTDLLVANQEIKLKFCYKNHFMRTEVLNFNASTYYNELAFDSLGTLTDPLEVTTDANAILQNAYSTVNVNVPKKIPLPWYPANTPEINANFDLTGLGTSSEFLGWAVCNGLNGTPDLRGQFIVGAINNVPNTGAPALASNVLPGGTNPNYSVSDVGGSSSEVLTTSQIPAHSHGGTTSAGGGHTHSITDPGHTHEILGQNGFGGLQRARTGQGNTEPSVGTESSVTGISIAAEPDHTHVISSEGGGLQHNNLIPYYSLLYVMRIA